MPHSNPEELAAAICGKTCMLIGGPGAGKSTLCRAILDVLSQDAEKPAALISADVGQPSVGVPTCLALSLDPARNKPAALWFVGDVSPVGNLLPVVVGTGCLADKARTAGASTVLIDTSGLVDGGAARVLKYHKLLSAGVGEVIAVERNSELGGLRDLVSRLRIRFHRLPVHPRARRRDVDQRRAYRRDLFAKHFDGAAIRDFDAAQLVGTDWASVPKSDWHRIAPGTVVGFVDGDGFCSGLGLFDGCRGSAARILTACADSAPVARLQLGRVRIDRSAGFAEQPTPGI